MLETARKGRLTPHAKDFKQYNTQYSLVAGFEAYSVSEQLLILSSFTLFGAQNSA